MTAFTIDDARRVQADLGLLHKHVIYIDDTGFVIAHTAAERGSCMMDLADCNVHRWLSGDPVFSNFGCWLSCCFREHGWYTGSLHDVKGLAL